MIATEKPAHVELLQQTVDFNPYRLSQRVLGTHLERVLFGCREGRFASNFYVPFVG
jgi:hypothetical protein